jgi:hypothetical protein
VVVVVVVNLDGDGDVEVAATIDEARIEALSLRVNGHPPTSAIMIP